jgi:hypothetical protein
MERNTFKTVEAKKKEDELKEYLVECSENHYMTYKVKAKNEAEAREIVNDGGLDIWSDDYGNYEIHSVRLA